ncbi:hypothetical protein MMC19_003482 [Ptychographa xylographoides]|nr:hypothetical protein [Ptychographa xylographoides]
MPGRVPILSDFPSHLFLTITPPPNQKPPANVLVLLHGLGDTNGSFTKLGVQLALPETVCISLQAPNPLPFEIGGFHWGDDIIFDQTTGQMDFDTGFQKTTKILSILIQALLKKCQFQARELFIFGFGQGGMTALATVSSSELELGGIVSIGGPLPTSIIGSSNARTSKNKTPLLLCGGSAYSLMTPTEVDKMKTAFAFVEYRKWRDRNGDGMPRNREEMLPIMQFFARRLRSRAGVPEGSVEIG